MSVQALQLGTPIRLLFASDLHLGLPWTRRAAVDLLRAARHTRPHLILIGGDLLDSPAIPTLRRLLGRLVKRCPVYVTAGNHDRPFPQLPEITGRDSGAQWLPDRPKPFQPLGGKPLRITDSPTNTHTSAEILCTHDPAAAIASTAPLAFAGHLHGGQCVLGPSAANFSPAASSTASPPSASSRQSARFSSAAASRTRSLSLQLPAGGDSLRSFLTATHSVSIFL